MSCKHCGGTRLTGDVVEREGIGDPCPHCHGETQGRGEELYTWKQGKTVHAIDADSLDVAIRAPEGRR